MRMADLPDEKGHFGPYGGVFVAETLIHALDQLRDAYLRWGREPSFLAEFESELKHYVGRPSPVYHARRWSEHFGGAQVYLKREDLNHTGAHKINNTLGQAMLARRMGKPRVIAETGAGMHGVAAATVAVATPCWPAPVSAISRRLLMRRASTPWPMQLLILCAPVWLRSSRFKWISAPSSADSRRA